MNTIAYIKRILKLGSTPGYLLIGYYIVQSFFARQKNDATAIDLSAIIFAAYSMICLFVGIKVLFEKPNKNISKNVLFKTPLIWFVLYTIWGGISSFWSIHFALTAYRAIECLGMTAIILATLTRLSRYNNINLILDWTAVYVFLSIMIRFVQYINYGVPLIPSIGYGGAFECAQMIATIFCFLAWFYVRNKIIKITILIFAVFSMSTTGYIGMALGLVAYFWGTKREKKLAIMGTIIISLVAFLYGPEKLLKDTVFIERSEIDYTKMSGRDQIWELGIEWVKKRPLTGYGFVAGESFLLRLGEGRMGVIGMHNTFMSALVGEGLIGLFLITMFWITMTKTILSKAIPIRYRVLLLSSYIASFIQSIANPGIGFRVYGSWMASMYICILICVIYKVNFNKISRDKINQKKKWITKQDSFYGNTR